MKLLMAGIVVLQSAICLAADPFTASDASVPSQFLALAASPVPMTAVPAPSLDLDNVSSTRAVDDLALVPTRSRLTPPSPSLPSLYLAELSAATGPAPADPSSAPPVGANDATELAKKLSNPVANLISVPFQYNADFNAGTSGKAQRSYLNIQPVIPFSLTKDWNLITRTILPIIYQEQLVPGQGTNWGLGDTTASFFLSPKAPFHGWIWGVGPVFYLPTATDTALGTGQWGAGVTGVALRQEHGWTYGILANQIWSVWGDGDRPYLNSTFLQPFISYTFPTATSITLNTESTYDWNGNEWTVPINLVAAQLVKVGRMPVQFQFGGRYYAEGPSGTAEWGLRFSIVFLFPR